MIELLASAVENNDPNLLSKIFDINFINKSYSSLREIAENPHIVKTRIRTKPWDDILINIANMTLCAKGMITADGNTTEEFKYFSKATSLLLQCRNQIDIEICCSIYRTISQTCLYFSSNDTLYNDVTTLLRRINNSILIQKAKIQMASNNPTLAVVNAIARINLLHDNYDNAETAFGSLDQPEEINSDSYNVGELATFYFLKGKVDMVYGHRNSAYQEFKKSLQYIPLNYKKDRRLVLLHFIPVSLSFGQIPTDELLKKYDLYNLYSNFTTAISTGNLTLFNQELNNKQLFLIHYGIWEMIVYSRRILMRRILQMAFDYSDTNRLPINYFQSALCLFGDYSYEDTVLELSNLIFEKLAMANVAYQLNLVVFKDKNKDEFRLPDPEESDE